MRHISRCYQGKKYECASQYFNNSIIAQKSNIIKPAICYQITCNINTKPNIDIDIQRDGFLKSFFKKVGWTDLNKAVSYESFKLYII